jgi:hypothetical protein
VAAVINTDSEDHDAAKQLAVDGARSLRGGDPLDARGTRSLLSSARHELGSPLQTIQGFTELLASESFGPLSQEQQGFLEHVLTATNELRSAMEACLELAELELVGRASSVQRGDLQGALIDTLEQVQQRIGVVVSAQPSSQRTRVMLDRDLFRRAFETLLIALAVRDGKSFVVGMEADAEYALVTVARTDRRAYTETLPLPVLAAGRPITRNLLWLRLAAALFAAQDATLSLAESLDYAEVRIRLRPTH